MRLSQLHRSYLQDMLSRGMSTATIRNYESDFRSLVAFLGADDTRALSVSKLMTMPTWLAGQAGKVQGTKQTAGAVRRKLAGYSSFTRWLVKRGDLSSNPFDAVDRPKLPKRLPRPISPEAIASLLALPEATVQDRAMLAIMRYGGLRISEVASLCIEDVDLQHGAMRVIGKGNKERVLPILEQLRPYLVAWLDQRRVGPGSLFINRSGRRWSTDGIRTRLIGLARTHGVAGFTPHRVRHTFGTWAIRAGVKLRVVQQMMGHENPATTTLYAEVTAADLGEAASILQAYDHAGMMERSMIENKHVEKASK